MFIVLVRHTILHLKNSHKKNLLINVNASRAAYLNMRGDLKLPDMHLFCSNACEPLQRNKSDCIHPRKISPVVFYFLAQT
jgi:hypothetical protein